MVNTGLEFSFKLKNSDKKAYEEVFFAFYEPLCNYAFFYIRDMEAAEEIIQELFISLWEKREQIEIKTTVNAYLYYAVKNRSLNYLRDIKGLRKVSKDITEFNLLSENNYNYLELNELTNLIESAIGSLPEKCKDIFMLSREENLTYQEIADKLQISKKTVENQLSIALKKIRAHLEPYLDKVLLFFISQVVPVIFSSCLL